MIETIVFDLDGTLLDTLGDLCDSVNLALVPRGFAPVTEEQTRMRIGNGVRKLIERSLPEDKREQRIVDDCLDSFRTAYEKRMQNRTQPYEGIVPLLRALKKQGITVGVLSNKYDLAAKELVRSYFGDLVQHTMGERPNVLLKPDPESLLALVRQLGGKIERTLYVGDSLVDLQTGQNAGISTVSVGWGFGEAEQLRGQSAAHIEAPEELLTIAEQGLVDIDGLYRAFTARGFGFTYFETAEQALAYLNEQCAGKQVSLGGSMTLRQLGFPEKLDRAEQIFWHWVTPGQIKTDSEVFITSANAVSQNGEIVNIDGTGNRVACTLYGPKRCIFVCGLNKLCPNLESAIQRARMVAAPQNNKRLQTKNPCTTSGKCHDCHSASRICRAMVIHMGPVNAMPSELVLIGQRLGY